MPVRIIDAAIGASWAMEEPALATLLEIAAREHEVTPQALEAMRSETLEKSERAKVRDGVAIVYAEGAMFKRANLMTEFCGATSYESLMRDFKVAVDNQNVRAILLAIDTPGGEAAGVGELASAVRAARGTKPIVAYAGDLAASAGYWLASAADRIVIGSGAAVGSIGVRASYSDTSERDARSGVRRHEFVSSQSPYKISDPKTTDGKARIKARVDALAQVFVDAVADNRGVSVAHVLDAFGKGDVLIGEAAVKAGMADAIGTFESTLASLASQTDPLSAIGLSTAALSGTHQENATMPTEDEMKAAVDAAVKAAEEKAAADQATAVAAATEAATRAATETANAAERDRVSALYGATVAGYEAERDEAIKTGSTVDAFKALIVTREHAKAADRAKAIDDDANLNASVRTVSKTEPKGGDEAAVSAILEARKLAFA
ncbi:S49 family peptidase [Methylobacterium sp. WCS2018Hpa-22]|uniref:S49 family peptidase n=1 Tax=Methylobacterium sp. WCS2018Hpa-22 TaxID=3073633 RepID=UPI00288B353A|nr:S49 family peptidase [Methylobacterium sp. WCS2018Hpa-22]